MDLNLCQTNLNAVINLSRVESVYVNGKEYNLIWGRLQNGKIMLIRPEVIRKHHTQQGKDVLPADVQAPTTALEEINSFVGLWK